MRWQNSGLCVVVGHFCRRVHYHDGAFRPVESTVKPNSGQRARLRVPNSLLLLRKMRSSLQMLSPCVPGYGTPE